MLLLLEETLTYKKMMSLFNKLLPKRQKFEFDIYKYFIFHINFIRVLFLFKFIFIYIFF